MKAKSVSLCAIQVQGGMKQQVREINRSTIQSRACYLQKLDELDIYPLSVSFTRVVPTLDTGRTSTAAWLLQIALVQCYFNAF
jgi:hypothetical protein